MARQCARCTTTWQISPLGKASLACAIQAARSASGPWWAHQMATTGNAEVISCTWGASSWVRSLVWHSQSSWATSGRWGQAISSTCSASHAGRPRPTAPNRCGCGAGLCKPIGHGLKRVIPAKPPRSETRCPAPGWHWPIGPRHASHKACGHGAAVTAPPMQAALRRRHARAV